jgi:hypothetical protein
MKKSSNLVVLACFALMAGIASSAAAQGVLDRLESGIRASNGQPTAPPATTPRVYLGARADDDAGRGVRVLSISNGGPADRAGLQAEDLIVGAAGRRIGLLSELTTILSHLNPGDRLTVEFVRGTRPLRTEIVLGPPPGAAQPGQPGMPPPSGLGAGRTETIPPPPGTIASPPMTGEGPSLVVPNTPGQPFPPKSAQAQIDALNHRIDQLERRIEELERALAESRRK